MPLITSAMAHFCWQIKVVPDQRPLTFRVIRHLSRGFKAKHLLLVSQQVYLFRAIDSACDQLPGQTRRENLMTLSEGFFPPTCSLTQMSCGMNGRETSYKLKAQTADIADIMDNILPQHLAYFCSLTHSVHSQTLCLIASSEYRICHLAQM